MGAATITRRLVVAFVQDACTTAVVAATMTWELLSSWTVCRRRGHDPLLVGSEAFCRRCYSVGAVLDTGLDWRRP